MSYIIMNYIMRRRICFLFLFLIGFLFYSCEKIDIGEDINIQIGEEYRVKWNLSFRIDSLNEYRCPINANCIWGGDVDLYFSINEGSHETDTLLRLNDSKRNPFETGNHLWEILDVSPYPELEKEIEINDIIVVMRISKK